MAGRADSSGVNRKGRERGRGTGREEVEGVDVTYSVPPCLERSNRRRDCPQSHPGQPALICIKFIGAFCHLDLYHPGAHTHSPTPPTHAHHRPTHCKGTASLIQETTDPCLFSEHKPHGHSKVYSDTPSLHHRTHMYIHITQSSRHIRPSPDHSAHLPHPIAT